MKFSLLQALSYNLIYSSRTIQSKNTGNAVSRKLLDMLLHIAGLFAYRKKVALHNPAKTVMRKIKNMEWELVSIALNASSCQISCIRSHERCE